MTKDAIPGRVHALDSLRAVMMLLGVVVHSALTYGVSDYKGDWGIKDPLNTSVVFDHLVHFVHLFRMPLFFVMAGFFGARLFYEKGPLKMIRNRIDRILLPLIIFVSFLFPLSMMSFIFTQHKMKGNPEAARMALEGLLGLKLSYYSTVHLWFLYYLFMFSCAAWALGLLSNRAFRITRHVNRLFSIIVSHALLRTLLLSCMTFFCLLWMGAGGIKTPLSFRPEPTVFLTYFLIYLVGWLLYQSGHLLTTLSRWGWLQVAVGLIFFMIKVNLPPHTNGPFFHLKQFANTTAMWCFIFGFTALFLTHFNDRSASIRYLSDASYWVYLVHLPIVVLIPGFLTDFDLSPFLKFMIVFSLANSICLLSYHWFVRLTFIGRFLRGQGHSLSLFIISHISDSYSKKSLT